MTFRVGQKVVCVDDSSISNDGRDCADAPGDMPMHGAVYTVANVYVAECGAFGRVPAVELVELSAPGNDEWWPGFMASRFRPAVDRKTDISIFKKICDDVDKHVSEDA